MGTRIEAGDISGADYLRLIAQDPASRPDVWNWAGLSLQSHGDGWAEIAYNPQHGHRNTVGTVHGGIYGVLLDTAMGCALFTRMPKGLRLATMTFTVHLVRPILAEDEHLTVRGEIGHLGRRQATAKGDILGADGRLVGHGSGSFLLLEKDPHTSGKTPKPGTDTE